MKAEFVKYYGTLGIGPVILERISRLYADAEGLTPEPLTDTFISEYVSDGLRTYSSLFFFSPHTIIEFKDFLTTDKMHLDVVLGRIVHLQFEAEDFDLESYTQGSRFFAYYHTQDNLTTEMRASADNCLKLVDLAKKYLVRALADIDFTSAES